MMEAWIGLAHVKPRIGNDLLEGAAGAFVPVVAIAEDFDRFLSVVYNYLHKYQFEIIGVEDVELFREREEHDTVDEDIRDLVNRLTHEAPIALSMFEAYETE